MSSILKWEPRITNVVVDINSLQDQHFLIVSMSYTIRITGQEENISIKVGLT